jgi:intein/homing endonuclease
LDLSNQPIDASYIAGFFDGEGCVDFFVGKLTIRRIWLVIAQKSTEILGEISLWLSSHGIKVIKISPITRGNVIIIRGIENIRRWIELLAPFVRIKKNQLIAVSDYLTNKITGDEFVHVMNDEVSQGKRSGKMRPLPDLRWTRSVGRSMKGGVKVPLRKPIR